MNIAKINMHLLYPTHKSAGVALRIEFYPYFLGIHSHMIKHSQGNMVKTVVDFDFSMTHLYRNQLTRNSHVPRKTKLEQFHT